MSKLKKTLLKISFCTTCMGRLDHLKETFLRNVQDNQDYIAAGGELEFVLVNYGGEEETDIWAKEHLQGLIDEGIVIYASYPQAEYFRGAHAQNMAHRLASGNILANVDADNFTGEGFATFIADKFAKGTKCLHPNSFLKGLKGEKIPDGCYGRIVISKKTFEAVQGYSESITGWGVIDTNMMYRVTRHHARVPSDIPMCFLTEVDHSDDMRVANMAPEHVDKSIRRMDAVRHSGVLKHRLRILTRPFTTPVKANTNGNVGCGEVYINFSDTPITIAPFNILETGQSR